MTFSRLLSKLQLKFILTDQDFEHIYGINLEQFVHNIFLDNTIFSRRHDSLIHMVSQDWDSFLSHHNIDFNQLLTIFPDSYFEKYALVMTHKFWCNIHQPWDLGQTQLAGLLLQLLADGTTYFLIRQNL